MFACVALALLNFGGYLRHLDSGDQAGFALGTFFLIGECLPIAAVLLLIGAILAAPPGLRQEGRTQRTIAMTALIAGAVFFLAYGLWMALTFRPSRPSWTELLLSGSGGATVLAFSVNALACALALRPGSASSRGGGPRLLPGVILAISVIVAFQIAAYVSGAFRGDFLVGYLPFVAGPTLLWIAALLRSAWLLHHEGMVAQSEGSKLGGM